MPRLERGREKSDGQFYESELTNERSDSLEYTVDCS